MKTSGLQYIRLSVVLTILLPDWTSSWFGGPIFRESPVNVTVNEGDQAFLPCRVINLGDKSVTWMRKKNLHILTAGMLTYSPDDRFKVLHPPGSEEWTLHIKFTHLGDGGWYECQVNSDPKITRRVLLLVKDKSLNDPFYEPEFEIVDNRTEVEVEGPSERYMQQGSILSLVCSIRHRGVRGPELVAWFHGAVRLHYDSPRGGIALQTEKTSERTVSRLRLSNVTPRDSGRYSCRPDTGGISSVSVHIQSSQHHAAVQHNTHSSGVGTSDYSSKSSVALQFVFLLASGHAVIASHFR
ncbi:protein sidekick-1-like [Macrobrachium nipponense]|uniref:protein sidekick-1-like n=1 Tax=Macrobrachium nipponense TaxID=159736 RepID=UPI0030C80F4B